MTNRTTLRINDLNAQKSTEEPKCILTHVV